MITRLLLTLLTAALCLPLVAAPAPLPRQASSKDKQAWPVGTWSDCNNKWTVTFLPNGTYRERYDNIDIGGRWYWEMAWSDYAEFPLEVKQLRVEASRLDNYRFDPPTWRFVVSVRGDNQIALGPYGVGKRSR